MAKFQNRDKLLKKLSALPPVAKQEIGKALEKGASELVSLQKNLVPKGRTKKLFNSIKYIKGSFKFENSGVLGRSKSKLNADFKGDPDLTFTVTAGDKEAFYARFVELGTASHEQPKLLGGRQHPGAKATPFFYPAYRSLRKRIKSSITRATTKSAKRVAGK